MAVIFCASFIVIALMGFLYFEFVSKTVYEESVSHLTEVFHQSDTMLKELANKNLTYLHMWGEYTLTDYYQIPDERRVELIDGVIYDMSAPGCDHQLIAGLIHARLLAHVSSRKGTCLPMISPVDVQLDCDEKTMVQPDVVVVCDRSKVIRRCIYGAPDLVIEILSPSTRRKDVTIKLNKYIAAGVREYWIIDPDQCRVLVYDFSAAIYPVIYGFDAKIPVAIWDGDCVIDFQEVYDYIHFLYEKDPNPPQ